MKCTQQTLTENTGHEAEPSAGRTEGVDPDVCVVTTLCQMTRNVVRTHAGSTGGQPDTCRGRRPSPNLRAPTSSTASGAFPDDNVSVHTNHTHTAPTWSGVGLSCRYHPKAQKAGHSGMSQAALSVTSEGVRQW